MCLNIPISLVRTEKLINIKVKKNVHKKVYFFGYFGFHSKGGLSDTPLFNTSCEKDEIGILETPCYLHTYDTLTKQLRGIAEVILGWDHLDKFLAW